MHSRTKIPLTALSLLSVALTTLTFAAGYTIYVNPEILLYRRVAAIKEKWIQQLGQAAPKYIIFGGSSCAASIMGQRLLYQYGLRAANLGLNAGMGAKVLTRYAVKHTCSRDTLIMAIEPELLAGSSDVPSLGKQFALATGNADLLESTTLGGRISDALALRPGGYHFFTLLAKTLSGQPLYRYTAEDFDISGYQRVVVRRDFAVPPQSSFVLSSSAHTLLNSLTSTCHNRGVRLAYTLPWMYTPPENVKRAQSHNLEFLVQVAEFMPILADEKVGTDSVREHYADTELHLTPEAAALRTDALAKDLKEWKTWSVQDLQRMRDSL